jgi:hypothetical protein
MSQFNTGYKALQETITSGGNTVTALQSLSHCANQNETVDLFAGAVACVKDVFQAISAAGSTVPTFKDQHLNDFLTQGPATMSATLTQNLTLRHEQCGAQVAALAVVVDQHKGKISFTTKTMANVAPQPEPTQPPVRQEPIEVRVIGMPMRITTSKIDRDSSGNIVGASNLEQDVAA